MDSINSLRASARAHSLRWFLVVDKKLVPLTSPQNQPRSSVETSTYSICSGERSRGVKEGSLESKNHRKTRTVGGGVSNYFFFFPNT